MRRGFSFFISCYAPRAWKGARSAYRAQGRVCDGGGDACVARAGGRRPGDAGAVQPPQVHVNPRLQLSFWLAGGLVLAWSAVLGLSAVRADRVLAFDFVARSQHYVQACMQSCVYLYWGWYWPPVYAHLPHIAAQVAFAYGFDSLLAWSRRERWTLGFGPLPIILSTNLFLWFRDDYYTLQFLMVAVGIAGKEFVTWRKEGRRAHIFNPSALSLWIFSLGLLLTGRTDVSWARDIATTLVYPEYIYPLIFLVGLVVQYLFRVTLTTLGAAMALLALNAAYTGATGVYYFVDSSIPIAVFLGLHLLVTDPSTSPRTDLGRFAFGALYGAGVFALYGLLELIGQPTFYDKLLCVPLLNLSVRAIDYAARRPWLERVRGQSFGLALDPARRNLVYMAVWITLFGTAYGMHILDKHHPGARTAFWQEACSRNLRNACRSLATLESSSCSRGSATNCNELGVLLMEKAQTEAAHRDAAAAFERACTLGLDAGCANTAIERLFHDDKGTLDDALLARLEQGCAANDGRACYLRAYALELGRAAAPDLPAALADYTSGCAAGWAAACAAAGKLALRGAAGAPDPARAAASFDAGCQAADAASCVQLALLYRNGTVPVPAGVVPEDLLRRACQLGMDEACRAVEAITR